MTYDNDVFSRHLRAHMALAGINSADALSEKAGVSVDSVGRYMRGESVPLLSTVFKLAEALGCSPNELCGWSQEGGN